MIIAVEHNTAVSEDLDAARNVVEALLKARKIMKIYPGNNPVYIKYLENTFVRLEEFFNYRDKLTFTFGRSDIFYDGESVYSNLQKQENFTLLFYKDGIREITFNNDVTRDEIEDFLGIIAADFDRETVEDDIVTLLWQRDFRNIKYFAEDIHLTEEAVDELNTITELKQGPSAPADVKKAYYDSFGKDEVPLSVPMIPLTSDDYHQHLDELEEDSEVKLSRFFNMLFELFYDVERSVEYEDIVYFFIKAIEYAIKKNKLSLVTDVLVKLKEIIGIKDTGPEMRKGAIKIIMFVSGRKMIYIIGNILDKGERIEKEEFHDFICSLDRHAISQLVHVLFDLQNEYAIKLIIDAVSRLVVKISSTHKIHLKETAGLIRGLNHPEWYVVSKIIHILSEMGDINAIEHIVKLVKHDNFQVRVAAVKALGELGRDSVLGTLREYLDDHDINVRKASLAAIGNITAESSKKIIMEQIARSSFIEKDLEEKKEYFRILCRWNDKSIYDFCIQSIKKQAFWKKSKCNEIKACAVYSLGRIGNKDALPVLNKCKTSRNRLLREFSKEAIRRIEHDG